MSSPIKLWYYDFKGRAECIRLLLSLAGQDFEDIRFSVEDWPKYKSDAPYGQSPYIELNGQKYGQSLAIIQHLAREYDLYGQSHMDSFTIDQVIHLILDLAPLSHKIIFERDQDKKSELEKEMSQSQLPKVLGYIEEIIKQNGTGFLVGNQLSLGDLMVFDLCNSNLKPLLPALTTDFPLISAVCEKVETNDKIKAYLASRPDTAY